jgi:hypothetical protein
MKARECVRGCERLLLVLARQWKVKGGKGHHGIVER